MGSVCIGVEPSLTVDEPGYIGKMSELHVFSCMVTQMLCMAKIGLLGGIGGFDGYQHVQCNMI